MKQSTVLKAVDFPMDQLVQQGYLCPICGTAYTSPGWCPRTVFGNPDNLQAHPSVALVPDK